MDRELAFEPLSQDASANMCHCHMSFCSFLALITITAWRMEALSIILTVRMKHGMARFSQASRVKDNQGSTKMSQQFWVTGLSKHWSLAALP